MSVVIRYLCDLCGDENPRKEYLKFLECNVDGNYETLEQETMLCKECKGKIKKFIKKLKTTPVSVDRWLARGQE